MLATNAVTTSALSAGCVTTDKIADGSITTSKFGAASISTAQLAAGAVTDDKTNFTNLVINGDLTITGNLTALGASTLIDTVVSVTSALSVINAGTGPALVAGYRDTGITLFVGSGNRVGVNTAQPAASFTVNGSLSTNNTFSVQQTLEKTLILGSITDDINYDVLNQSIILNNPATLKTSWSVNFRGNSTTTLNSIMYPGQAITCVHLVSTTSLSVFCSGVRVDGTAVTPLWQGGAAPVAGDLNSIDAYTFTIIKIAESSFRVLASSTQFA